MVARQSRTKPKEASSVSPRLRSRGRVWGLALLAATAVAYFPAYRAGYIWDDDAHVTNNETLRSLGGLGRIWTEIGAVPQYYPLVHTTFWVEYHLWGLNPVGYHVVNVLLHGLGAVLLWRLLLYLRIPGAWLAAAVFALHPVHVESVAWITERKNVLSGFLYLAAAGAYLRFALEPGESAPRGVHIRWYIAALLLFLGALLSKTVTGSLPAALLLVLWWRRGRIRAREVYPLLPFFVSALVLGLLTAAMERHHVGAVGEDWNLSAVDRCLVAGRALWFYAGKLVCPWPLIFLYPRWVIDSHQWWHYLFPGAALAVVAGLWFARHRIGRGPLVAVLFFGGTLVPALGFFNVYPMRFSFVADHFQYLASIGLIVLVVAAALEFMSRVGPKGRSSAVAAAAGVLLVLGVLTSLQTRMYRDIETLWSETIARNPGAWLAHNNLAPLLVLQGKLDEAIACSTEALRLRPDYIEACNNRGIAYGRKGEHDLAIKDYTRAIELKPDYADAYYNRGNAYSAKGNHESAVQDFNKAIEHAPGFVQAINNRALSCYRLKQYDQAWADVRRLRQLGHEPHPALLDKLTEATGRTE